jgi:uncharacterized coiled-coil protein SlyX
VDDVTLEHRLTKLEQQIAQSATFMTAAHQTILERIDGLTARVGAQNGRISKLESWKTQVSTVYGVFLAAAPFVFYGLLRLFGA